MLTANEKIRIAFIVNPASGSGNGQRYLEAITQYLNKQKFEPAIIFTEKKGDTAAKALACCNDGFQVCVAVGGDGTFNEMASALLDKDMILGVLPAGSGNGLATCLGMQKKTHQAIRTINEFRVKKIDVGQCNAHYFFNVAGVGFTGKISEQMRNNKIRGWRGYMAETMRGTKGLQFLKCKATSPIHSGNHECLFVEVSNGTQFGYHFEIAPDAYLDDGMFDVCIMQKAPVWKYFASAWRLFNGSINKSTLVKHFKTAEIQIHCDAPQYYHVDGEGFWDETSKFDITILKHKLNVIYNEQA